MRILTALCALAIANYATAQTPAAEADNGIPASNSIPAPGAHGAVVPAAEPTSPPELTGETLGTLGKTRPSEAAILKELHASNLAEVQQGELAIRRATSAQVKAYAAMLVKDHAQADRLVTREAQRLQVPLDDALPPTAQGDLERFESVVDGSFDKVFCDIESSSHAAVIADVEMAQRSTSDRGLRKLLGKLLPTLKKHEQAAQRLSENTLKAS